MNPTPFETANRNLTTLYGNMIAAYSVNTAIHQLDRKSTRLNSSHVSESRMPSSA